MPPNETSPVVLMLSALFIFSVFTHGAGALSSGKEFTSITQLDVIRKITYASRHVAILAVLVIIFFI